MADVLAVSKIVAGPLGDRLAPHITDDEIEAFADRVTDLVQRPVMPQPRTHRPIPWPAF
jgi:hypothetical protein